MLGIHRGYLMAAILLLTVEVLIALFVHDRLVRPYLGDVLVVVLIYCTLKACFNLPPFKTATGVLLFAFLIETLQYFRIFEHLGWKHSPVARAIIGTSFSFGDMVCYIAGYLIIIVVEKYRSN